MPTAFAAVTTATEETVSATCIEANKTTVKISITIKKPTTWTESFLAVYFNLNWDSSETVAAENIQLISSTIEFMDTEELPLSDILGGNPTRADFYGWYDEFEEVTVVISCDANDAYDTLYLSNIIPNDESTDQANVAAIASDYNSEGLLALDAPLAIPLSGPVPPNPTEIPAEDITNSTGGAATVATSVDASTNTATINVVCDTACVVAYTTDGGTTYTRMTAEANGSTYDFSVAYNSNMQFVVAVKGDADGNGTINANDLSLFVNASNGDFSSGTYSESLMRLIGDTDSNNLLDANDLSTLVNASNGSALGWDQ